MYDFKDQKTLISNKVIHFIGIGGIGMSGIANLLFSLGFNIQGSDVAVNSNIERLQELGIKVYIGHKESNLQAVDIVVISTAIKQNNVELQEAQSKNLPIYTRGRILGEIMGFYYGIAITGAHGKTTTTSLIGDMLMWAGLEPTVVVGGVVNDWKSNIKLGKGKVFVAEADESDGSFLKMPSIISVVTNIENEHLDYYKTSENLKKQFIEYINKVPFFGKAILCIDDEGVQEVIDYVKNTNIATYGVSSDADYRAYDIKFTNSGTEFSVFIKSKNITIEKIKSNLHGHYNVLNALAALTVIDNLNINYEHGIKSLANFKGINRRFTKVGHYKGIEIIDDYAHHPSEIKAVLNSARNIIKNGGKIRVVLQPHRYTRLKDCFKEFIEVLKLSDSLFVLPVYSAGEVNNGYTSEKLVNSLKESGFNNSKYVANEEELVAALFPVIKENDLIINMGAGDITLLAKNLHYLLERKSHNN